MMFSLEGMTALVTGASGGLGSSIAKALASQGARLALSGSNVDKLDSFRSGLGGDHTGDVLLVITSEGHLVLLVVGDVPIESKSMGVLLGGRRRVEPVTARVDSITR